MHDRSKDPAPAPATLELLAWLDEGQRTYVETMDAWRTHCPRLSAWEDALADRLVRVTRNGAAAVALTSRGRAALAA
jgi:hypothetical protein